MKWDLATVQSYINNGVEESLNLDYKAADALQKTDGKKKEISKDVSAMANSAGGIIMYGIKEFQQTGKEHLPELIDSIKRTDISKEWLEQVINSNIQPKVEGIIITPVTVEADTVVYVVEIPQSGTAHQASDKRYYKRYNFESIAMEDYEVRDIMSRVKHPVVELDFIIERKMQQARDPINKMPKPGGQQWMQYNLKVSISNKGKVYANYVNYFLELPEDILNNDENLKDSPTRSGYKVYYGENTIRDILDVKLQTFGKTYYNYGPSRYDPVLPGTKGRSETIHLKNNLVNMEYVLYWKIYADNAEERIGEIELSQVLADVKDV
jgi:hypothetical protein